MTRIGLMTFLSVSMMACSDAAPQRADEVAVPTDPALRAINDDYVASAKPLLERSCASCHGAGKELPWYHAVPWVRGMMDADIARARRNMDISHDFPFRGRGSPSDYLDAVRDVIDD